MQVVLGLDLDGPSFSSRRNTASVGAPVWGPRGLLGDLEVRLGLAATVAPKSMRVPLLAAKMAALADGVPFYAASFAIDPIGTAETVLAWRDSLVAAGWNGEAIPDGGERLADMTRIAAAIDGAMRGDADRLAAVATELAGDARERPYDRVRLVDHPLRWSGRWRSVFEGLQSRGTSIERFDESVGHGAPLGTDLGRLQEALRQSRSTGTPQSLSGDGSVLLVRAGTLPEAAELAAAVVGSSTGETVVVRTAESAPLEGALAAHGLPSQGLSSASACRPAMQILPLVVELAFEPRDPRRALELLTLSVGPFRGALGARLARALARAPGIGGREWRRRREEASTAMLAREVQRRLAEGHSPERAHSIASDRTAERLSILERWIEAPGADPGGVPTTRIRDLAHQVRSWLTSMLSADAAVYGPAVVQATAFEHAALLDERPSLSREDVRQILDTIVRATHERASRIERAGRVGHVSHPSALLAPCDTLVFACFTASLDRGPPVFPWSEHERHALEHAGVRLVSPADVLAAESASWRRALLAVRERVVFVVPDSIRGQAEAPHPLWDEIVACLQLDDAGVALISAGSREILRGSRRELGARVVDVHPLRLPEARTSWTVGTPIDPRSAGQAERGPAATSLEAFVACPLRWVLEIALGLASGAVTKIAAGSLLYGNLGHRLVEELALAGAFASDDEDDFQRVAEQLLTELVRDEGATLLLAGMAFERTQATSQLLRGVRELRRHLLGAGLRVVAVEEEVAIPTSSLGALRGRVDLRVEDCHGTAVIVDLKWGERHYRDLLSKGAAVQLAAYAHALRKDANTAMPPAAYFSLRSGALLTTDERIVSRRPLRGESLDDTWRRVDRTASVIAASLRRGVVPVAGLTKSLPLLDALGVPRDDQAGHFAVQRETICDYCSCSALCGQAWEPPA